MPFFIVIFILIVKSCKIIVEVVFVFGEKIDYNKIRICNSYKKIQEDLIKLGVKDDDTIICHSSLSSMGYVEYGAITFILALCDLVAKKGTVMFPAFSYIEANKNFAFSYNDNKVCVGLIPETFRNLENVIRSFHPTHSVCAIGKNAKEIIEKHRLDNTPLGKNSPFQQLPLYKGKLLMLGCGLYCNSFIHALEEIANVSYVLGDYKTYKMIDKDGTVSFKDYRIHHFIRENGNIIQKYDRTIDVLDVDDYSIGSVHGAKTYLIDSSALLKKGVEKLKENEKYFIDDPDNVI